MSIQKISFSSSLLDKNINKPILTTNPTPQDKPVEVDSKTEQTLTEDNNNNNHKVRNWSIGLGSAAVLLGLGFAGRKGKLGKGIQKMLGGLKEIKGATKDINIAEINAKLDRSIPELSEDLFKFKNTDFLKFTDLSQVKAAEVIENGNKLIQTHLLPGNYKQVLVADKATKKYILYFVTDASNNTLWYGGLDETGGLKSLFSNDKGFEISFEKFKQTKVVKFIIRNLNDNNYLVYDSNFNLNYHSVTDGNIQKTITYIQNSENKIIPNYVIYKNIEKNIKIKAESFDETGKNIQLETYYDEAGNLAKRVSLK